MPIATSPRPPGCRSHFPLALHRIPSPAFRSQVITTLSADGKPLSEEATRKASVRPLATGSSTASGSGLPPQDGRRVHWAGRAEDLPDRRQDVIGLAYAVMPDYWKPGFATEMGHAAWKWLRAAGLPRDRFMDAAGQFGFSAGDGEVRVRVRAGFRVRRAVAPACIGW